MGPPLVIGGGFAGLVNAYLLDGSLVYEEHLEVGTPPHCTGLVSHRVIGLLGPLARDHVRNRYERIVVRDLEGRYLVELVFREKIYRLDRTGIERALKQEAEDRGSRVILGARGLDILVERDRVCVAIGRVRGDMTIERVCIDSREDPRPLIVADGVLGSISRRFVGMRRGLLVGVQGVARRGFLHDSLDEITVFIDDRVFPGYFGWIVPLTEREVLVGGGWPLSHNVGTSLRYFLKRLARLALIEDENIHSLYGGLITRRYYETLYDPLVVLVGDAAGLTKPLTGGGLYTILYQSYSIKNSYERSSLDIESFKERYRDYMRPLLRELSIQRALVDMLDKIGVERTISVSRNLIRLLNRLVGIDYDYYISPAESLRRIYKRSEGVL